MPRIQKLTRKTLPKHLDEQAEDHNGFGWSTFNELMTLGETLNIKIRPVDIVAVYGVDPKTAKGWIRVYKES